MTAAHLRRPPISVAVLDLLGRSHADSSVAWERPSRSSTATDIGGRRRWAAVMVGS